VAGPFHLCAVVAVGDVVADAQPLHPHVLLVAVHLDVQRFDRVALLAHQQREVDRAAAAERRQQQLERRQSAQPLLIDEELRAVLVRDGDGVVVVDGHLEVAVARGRHGSRVAVWGTVLPR
jgi:hypothetical protein